MSVKLLSVEPELCTGCRICELRCSFKKSQEFSINTSRIKIVRLEGQGVYIPVVCSQCDPAPCEAVCPTDAIKRSADSGALTISKTACILCRACVIACPFGAIGIDPDGNIIKCDLCDGDPYCVKYCPTDALKHVSLNRALTKKRIRSAVNVVSLPEKENFLRELYYSKSR